MEGEERRGRQREGRALMNNSPLCALLLLLIFAYAQGNDSAVQRRAPPSVDLHSSKPGVHFVILHLHYLSPVSADPFVSDWTRAYCYSHCVFCISVRNTHRHLYAFKHRHFLYVCLYTSDNNCTLHLHYTTLPITESK